MDIADVTRTFALIAKPERAGHPFYITADGTHDLKAAMASVDNEYWHPLQPPV